MIGPSILLAEKTTVLGSDTKIWRGSCLSFPQVASYLLVPQAISPQTTWFARERYYRSNFRFMRRNPTTKQACYIRP